MAGTKFDEDKPVVAYVDPEFILAMARVLTYGARKYNGYNWTKGISYDRLYSAVQRHLLAHRSGELLDPETGESHLAHAACGIMFMFWNENEPGYQDGPGGLVHSVQLLTSNK